MTDAAHMGGGGSITEATPEADRITAVLAAWGAVSLLDNLRHPNVVNLLNAVCDDQGVHAVLAWWPETLLLRIRSGLVLDRREALRQVLVGLAFLHNREVVHNDLRPSHILIDAAVVPPKLCLADFGQAFVARRGFCQPEATEDLMKHGLRPVALPYRAPAPQFTQRHALN